MRNYLIITLLILLISVILSLPLLKPGLYVIHDDQQIARLFVFDQALKSGQFPVRWVDGLGFGFGYPLFNFYPPFVYFLGEIFHILGFGFVNSIKLVFFFSIFASGLAMYLFARLFFGRIPSMVSAMFYMAVPYRALDIYVRGALAESFSFVWLPLILWSFYKLAVTNKSIYLVLSSVFLALLMITHNLIFLPFMLILPFYSLFLIWKAEKKLLATSNQLLATILAFGLSAFFTLPALFEKRFTIVDDLLLLNLASYKIHFVYPQQLWNWTWGFGGSAAGLADGISFKIGKLHVLVSIGACILAFVHLIKAKQSKFPLAFWQRDLSSFQFPVIIFLLFLFSAFMTTFYSKPIWDLVKPLAYLQFPWRFLIFTAFFSSFLTGSFFELLKLPILRLFGSLAVVILLFTLNLKLFKPQSYRLDLTDKSTTFHEAISWYGSSSSFEYLPKGVELVKSTLDTNIVNITKNDIPTQQIEVLTGIAEINDLNTTPSKVDFMLEAKTDSKINANLFNFPGWQVTINENKAIIDDNNRLKLITFEVPKGKHNIKLEFKNTAVRTLSNLISSFSVLLLIVLFAKRWQTLKNN